MSDEKQNVYWTSDEDYNIWFTLCACGSNYKSLEEGRVLCAMCGQRYFSQKVETNG